MLAKYLHVQRTTFNQKTDIMKKMMMVLGDSGGDVVGSDIIYLPVFIQGELITHLTATNNPPY